RYALERTRRLRRLLRDRERPFVRIPRAAPAVARCLRGRGGTAQGRRPGAHARPGRPAAGRIPGVSVQVIPTRPAGGGGHPAAARSAAIRYGTRQPAAAARCDVLRLVYRADVPISLRTLSAHRLRVAAGVPDVRGRLPGTGAAGRAHSGDGRTQAASAGAGQRQFGPAVRPVRDMGRMQAAGASLAAKRQAIIRSPIRCTRAVRWLADWPISSWSFWPWP